MRPFFPRPGSAGRLDSPGRFGLLPVRSPLLGESSLLLEVLRCFSSPRARRSIRAAPGHHAGRVAPFGNPWIAGCQHLPRALRRVAASFIGRQRQGIHRAPIFANVARPSVAPRAPRSPAGPSAAARPPEGEPHPPRREPTPGPLRGKTGSGNPVSFTCQGARRRVEPRGVEPRTSAVQRRRSPC